MLNFEIIIDISSIFCTETNIKRVAPVSDFFIILTLLTLQNCAEMPLLSAADFQSPATAYSVGAPVWSTALSAIRRGSSEPCSTTRFGPCSLHSRNRFTACLHSRNDMGRACLIRDRPHSVCVCILGGA